MTIRKLIEAVERGEFHRKDGPAKFSDMADALVHLGIEEYRIDVLEQMLKGPVATVEILRALEPFADEARRAMEGGRDG